MMAYLDNVSSIIPSYDQLPDSIKIHHSVLSAQLIQNLEIPKYSDERIERIVNNLNACINSNRSQLNTIAYTDHKSNFRHNSIIEFFQRVGITALSSKIKSNKKFSFYLKER
jgi:uncharacterized protein YejL (UPF0352 family)